MRRILSLFAASLTAAALVAMLMVSVAGASDSHPASNASDSRIFSATLTPDLGPNVEPTIAGIAPGGRPWVLKSGHVNLSRGGLLEVSVEGLLFAPDAGGNLPGTRDGITQVSASLVCANGPVITTNPVEFSVTGNAQIHQWLSLPAHCVGPIVLIRALSAGPWLAATGF